MAEKEHVERLKRGVKGWNAWRKEYPWVQPNLSRARLFDVDPSEIDPNAPKIVGTNARIHMPKNRLSLSGVDLREADLSATNLSGADLSGADLHAARLVFTNLNWADLTGANLTEALLLNTTLIESTLLNADLSRAMLMEVTIAKTDLRTTKGLATVRYLTPSHIELFTVQLPQDGSALHFLRGVGVPDEWINDYSARMMSPVQYHSIFISYSIKDDLLARRLHADLQAQGVRCWFAPEDLKTGDKFRQRIDEAIHAQDKLLLLLSKDSIESIWVESEVEAALERENRQKREVLFPIRLDEMVMQSSQAWAATLRRTRHIGDFVHWSNPRAYQRAFDRLLRDLKQEE